MENKELLHEQKELQSEVADLRQQLQEFKLQSIDINDYLNWNAEEIVIWIMSVENGRFKKYEQTLLSSLKDKGIKGSYLSNINQIDINEWGIKNLLEKKKLMKCIQELVNEDKNDNVALVADMEGAISGGHFR